jgi:hypothetical protein
MKDVVRITKHKTPRHQLYHYGFNPNNSCWLEGKWVTLPKDEWEAQKDEHQKLFGPVHEAKKKQHHRDPATAIEDLTPAQRKAWEFYSGEHILSVQHPDGTVGLFGIETAADKMPERSIDYFRKEGIKVISKTKDAEGKVFDQADTYGVPEDLRVDTDAEPVDPWDDIVAQNKAREDDITKAFMEGAAEMPFFAQMAAYEVVHQEANIIRLEWNLAQGVHPPYDDLDAEIARYVERRRKVKETLGDKFEALYQQSRESHNSCARTNLDNSNRYLYYYVLPVFHEDGTHEPWGENDIPLTKEEREALV